MKRRKDKSTHLWEQYMSTVDLKGDSSDDLLEELNTAVNLKVGGVPKLGEGAPLGACIP